MLVVFLRATAHTHSVTTAPRGMQSAAMPSMVRVPDAFCTCCARRQPRRNPSRLRKRIVVLMEWNCTDNSCAQE